MAIAFALAGPAYSAPMSDSAEGLIGAAPAPWTDRQATRTAGPGASPQAVDEAMNSAIPVDSTGRRP